MNLAQFKTSGKAVELRNPGDITNWMTDRKGVVRLGIAASRDGLSTSVRIRADKKSDWETLATFRMGEPEWSPIMFAEDNDDLIVVSDHEYDRGALYRYDWHKREFVEKIWSSDDSSMVDVIYSGKRDKIVGVMHEGQKMQVDWLDPEFAELQKELDLAFPNQTVFIAPAGRSGAGPSDKEERQFLVRTGNSRSPTSYHLLDAKSFQMQRISYTRPWIDPDQMAEMKPITFTARDGRTIPGYLTLPANGPQKKLPMVLHPHGGP